MKDPFFLRRDDTLLVVIDVQEKLLPAMPPDRTATFLRYQKALVEGFKLLELPILWTEQYTKGLGPTTPELSRLLVPLEPLEKNAFSCMREDPFPRRLAERGRRQVVLCGIETHVCVLQTALDLLDQEYTVHIPEDAVGSRTEENRRNGLDLAGRAGAVITNTETVLFQLLERANLPPFKAVSRLIK